MQLSVLLAAATAEPPLVERVLAAPDHAPEAEKTMAELLTKIADETEAPKTAAVGNLGPA
ncbi:hypothetical protein RKD54_001682 [Pseudarthrobacter sp. SLBN-100]|uniref:hypothetical protein n=1 Tax=Arthrobacter sp. SLBN-100 TaxID=2768450 RepID=UPI001150F3A1|nr:hypothetical protein [Arthrobacter sp. SLBN-100]